MTATGMLTAAGVLACTAGVVVVFVAARVRARLTGLAAMASGALLALVAGDPSRAETWGMLVTSVATVVGLLAFAVALERRTSASGAAPWTHGRDRRR